MNYWKLRVDLSDDVSFDDVLSIVQKNSSTYVGVFEYHTKEGKHTKHHCHWYLESLTKGPTIRSQIKKLKLKRNEYSFCQLEEEKPIEYLAYILKEDKKPVISGISEELLRKINEYNIRVKQEIKTKKDSKKTKLERMISDFDLKVEKHISYETMLIKVIDWYRENDIYIRRHAIISEVDTLLMKYSETYREILIRELMTNRR